MKFDELKHGQKVRDSWFPEWGIGIVDHILKSRVKIQFSGEVKTYDKNHVKFLELVLFN